MDAAARARLEEALAVGCYCDGTTARLTRRIVNRGVTLYLQCDGCGCSFGSPLGRSGHYHYLDYPEWDDGLRDARAAKRSEALQQFFEGRRDERAAYWAQTRTEYENWCRTSPAWRDLSGAVIERAGGICEACLTRAAVMVHHLTYKLGVLPPAWALRAVCKECHNRLHADKSGDEDDWCPRSRES